MLTLILIFIVGSASALNTDICNKYCDGIAASEIPDTFEITSFVLFERRITFRGQREDNMAYGQIKDGWPGDVIWLERSWDFGESWPDGKIGEATIATGSTEVTTNAYNVDGDIERSRNKQIGVIRLCAKVYDHDEVRCTNLHRVPVCVDVCDGVDKSHVTDAVIIDRHGLHGRGIEVYASGKERVIYGRIFNAGPEDEVWLDRTYDGSRWGAGAVLGKAIVPQGANEAYTAAYNVDHKIGSPLMASIRVCAYVHNKEGIACTVWLRPPNCNVVCDDAPIEKMTDPQVVASLEVYQRFTLELVASPSLNASFGRIRNAQKGDDVWLDRSFDDGKTWEGRIGRRVIPENGTEITTPILNYDVTRPVPRQALIRACGAFGQIVCAKWTKPPEPPIPEPELLVPFFDCVHSIIDFLRDSGDSSYHKYKNLSPSHAAFEFKKYHCQDYGNVGNCKKCFREVYQTLNKSQL